MKKRDKKNLYIFLGVSFIFILLLVFILPKCLFGRNLFSYYIQLTKKYSSLYGKVSNNILMSSGLNYKFMWSRFLSFILIIFFVLFILWTKKNIKYERKIIYPIMYFIFLVLIYFSYLGYVMTWIGDSSDILVAPINNMFFSNLLFRILFIPINPLNFMFIILIKIGDMVDCKFRNRNYIPSIKLFYIGSLIFIIQFLICVVLSFMYGGL